MALITALGDRNHGIAIPRKRKEPKQDEARMRRERRSRRDVASYVSTEYGKILCDLMGVGFETIPALFG